VVGITGNIPKNWDVKDRLKTWPSTTLSIGSNTTWHGSEHEMDCQYKNGRFLFVLKPPLVYDPKTYFLRNKVLEDVDKEKFKRV
jgi:hypothetical protein